MTDHTSEEIALLEELAQEARDAGAGATVQIKGHQLRISAGGAVLRIEQVDGWWLAQARSYAVSLIPPSDLRFQGQCQALL